MIVRLDEYNAMARAAKNAEYLAKIDRAMAQIAEGKCAFHELIEVEDE